MTITLSEENLHKLISLSYLEGVVAGHKNQIAKTENEEMSDVVVDSKELAARRIQEIKDIFTQ